MTTQPKKPASRRFDRPIRYRAGVPQLTRSYLHHTPALGTVTVSDAAIHRIQEIIDNDAPSTRMLFNCVANSAKKPIDLTAAKAGTLNPIADIRGAAFIHQRFQFFFCEKRPAFL